MTSGLLAGSIEQPAYAGIHLKDNPLYGAVPLPNGQNLRFGLSIKTVA
jgi:hypothetical protein